MLHSFTKAEWMKALDDIQIVAADDDEQAADKSHTTGEDCHYSCKEGNIIDIPLRPIYIALVSPSILITQ